MITGQQIREARHILGWDQAELSLRSAMPLSVIERAESADGTPGIMLDQGNLLRQTFERAGLSFGKGSGVRMSAAEEELATPKTLVAVRDPSQSRDNG